MKKILLTLCVSCFSVAYSQTLTFTDAKFKTLILSSNSSNQIAKDINGNSIAIDTNGDGEIQNSEAQQIKVLNIKLDNSPSFNTLPDQITDVLLFTNIEELYITDTKSAVISFANNSKIKKVLYTGTGEYTDNTGTIQPVSIDFSFNNCSSVQDINQFVPDLNPNLSNSTVLRFENCPQLAGNIVMSSKAVKELYIKNCNNITSIHMESCYRLEKLHLPNLSSLTSIVFNGLTGPTWNSTYNQNIDLIATNCTNLQEIIADTDHYYSQGAYFTSINVDGCSNLKKIKGLNASIIDFSAAGLINLEELDCSFYNRYIYNTTSGVYFGNVTSLNLAGLPKLKILKAFNQPITNNVNFSAATTLEDIDITGSCGYMNTVNVSNLPNLHTLKTDRAETLNTQGNNDLQKIIAKNCTALINFNFKNNSKLKELVLENCQSLQKLTIGGYYGTGGNGIFPELNTINLKQCIALQELAIQTTPITALDITNCTALQSLELTGNDILLSAINISTNTNLESLSISRLPLLTQIDTSNNPNLKNAGFDSCPQITQLNFSNSPNMIGLSLSNMPNLTYVNLRNGSIEEYYDYSGYNTNLSMCVDDAELNDLQSAYPDIAFTTNCGSFLSARIPKTNINEIKIFPNPVKDFAQIQAEEPIRNVKILDPQGKIIFNQDFDRSLVRINLSNYPNAVYLVKIKTEKTEITKKIIKE